MDKMSIMVILDNLPQIPATKAKQAFGEMLDRLRAGAPLAITSHGRIKALLSTPESWRAMELESSRGVELAERQVARADQERVEFERLQRHAALAVELLSSDPEQQKALIDKARARVQRWRANDLCSEDYIGRWEAMLAKPVPILAKEMVSDCDGWGRSLRQNTPFTLKPQAKS